MSVIVADALGPPPRRDARCRRGSRRRCRSRRRAASRCRRRRAGSARTRTASSSGCLPAPRLGDPRERLHGAARPDLDPVVAVGATAALVAGSYSVGGTSTRPSARRTATMRPSRSPVRNRPIDGPDRARVAARVLEHVMGGEDVGQRAPSRRSIDRTVRSRGRGLPSRGRAACASTTCRWARAAARR